jgi:outer membrane lipoprotein-sorting protein
MLDPVRTPSIFLQHRSLRWLAPVGVLGVVGLAAGGMITARATPPNPVAPTTPAELLAAVQTTPAKEFSGTVVAQMSLGLPQLPAVAGDSGSSSMAGLLSGSHTLAVWYGGPDRQRVALLGTTSESDVFHSGADIWQWDSDTRVATHTVLAKQKDTSTAPAEPAKPTGIESLTPAQLATSLLAAIDPTTKVTIGAQRTVADRSAYDLVLTPRDSATTRIGSVHIAIDGATKLPLEVQVFPRGQSTTALDVAFSGISFKSPPLKYFLFTPPPGATVHTNTSFRPAAALPEASADATGATSDHVSTIGKGWSSVVEYHATAKQVQQVAGSSLSALQRVQGAWGKGRLLDTPLACALVTDDGRVFAGSVDPAALYAAATSH